MPEGWSVISIPDEVYEKAKKYYEEHEEELKIKHGVRSLSAFLNFCIREYLKTKGVI